LKKIVKIPLDTADNYSKMGVMREETKNQIDELSKKRGVHISFCQMCQVWTVHCPECGTNHCGMSCDCMPEYLAKVEVELDAIIAGDKTR
jgi:hypothetical protein